jgi:anti-sigma-K factor RskA
MTHKLDRGEIQDRLPDFVLGTLPADERAQVEAAIAADAELAAELDTVRILRAALSHGANASVDVDRIVGALPQPAVKARLGLGVANWRIAAAIATLAVGGASLSIVKQFRDDRNTGLTVVGETAGAPTAAGLAISFGYDLSTLSEEQLATLLADLERSNGLPPAEPRVTAAIAANNEGEPQ